MSSSPVDLMAYLSALNDAEASARALLDVQAPVPPAAIHAFAKVMLTTVEPHDRFEHNGKATFVAGIGGLEHGVGPPSSR